MGSAALSRARGAWTFCLIGFNPLLAWEVSGQAHNDGVMLLATMAFVWALAARREWLALLLAHPRVRRQVRRGAPAPPVICCGCCGVSVARGRDGGRGGGGGRRPLRAGLERLPRRWPAPGSPPFPRRTTWSTRWAPCPSIWPGFFLPGPARAHVPDLDGRDGRAFSAFRRCATLGARRRSRPCSATPSSSRCCTSASACSGTSRGTPPGCFRWPWPAATADSAGSSRCYTVLVPLLYHPTELYGLAALGSHGLALVLLRGGDATAPERGR